MPDEMPPLPPVATLPERPPAFNAQDEEALIVSRAHLLVETFKREREESKEREDRLQIQLTESVLARQSDLKKVEFLELENAELRNNLQALQSDIDGFRRLMSLIKQVLDNYGIEPPPKKPRKAKSGVTIEAVPQTSP
jgi:molecular chaperone GrpE (heat shock protein)